MTYEEEFGPIEPDRNEPETVQPHITHIEMVVDGPLMVFGAISVIHGSNGQSWNPGKPLPLCRCGRSNSKPFCDGEHEYSPSTLLPGGEIE